jgi:hypothetical protein
MGTGRSPERASSAIATTAYRDLEVTEIIARFVPDTGAGNKNAAHSGAVDATSIRGGYDAITDRQLTGRTCVSGQLFRDLGQTE